MNAYLSLKKNIAKLIKKTKHLQILLLPTVFLIVIFLANGVYFSLQALIQAEKIKPFPLAIPVSVQYPLLTKNVVPQISAEAALVMDADSQVVIFAKNPLFRFSPASTTKLMTALTGFQYFKPSQILEIKASNVEPVVVGFLKGQQVRFIDLLYGMLIPSGNDAALAISQNYPGGEDAFVAQMNRNAKLFHLFNTHYGDPVGLIDDDDYTTVVDLARLTTIALKNDTIKKIVGTKYATITTVGGAETFELKTTNDLLGINGVTGVKTGYTEGAGEVLVSSVARGNHTFIIIVMKSDDRFADTDTLIRSIIDNVTFLSMHP